MKFHDTLISLGFIDLVIGVAVRGKSIRHLELALVDAYQKRTKVAPVFFRIFNALAASGERCIQDDVERSRRRERIFRVLFVADEEW